MGAVLLFTLQHPGWTFGILVGAFVVLAGGSAYLDAVRRQNKFHHAIPAQARILHVGRSYDSGTFGGYDVGLTLEVIPPNGAPYQVKTTWSVEPLAVPNLKEGEMLAVRIDAKDTHKIYSGEKWAWAWSQIPPKYGNRPVFWYVIK